MSFAALIAILAMGQTRELPIDAAQFQVLIKSAISNVNDVSFVFEGFNAGAPEGTQFEDLKDDRKYELYQGTYAFRDDGATLLDCFNEHRYADSRPFETHDTRVILRGKLDTLSRIPDQVREALNSEAGGSGMLNRPGSPERINYLWYFKYLNNASWMVYEYQGWENVEGHKCLKVLFDRVPQALNRSPNRPTICFWIDLARGGNPLRVEYRDDDGPRGVSMRTEKIELERLPVAGDQFVWFPVRGRTLTFKTLGENTKQPIGFETYAVVDGTVRFNQKLQDAIFSVNWKGGLADTPNLAKIRREFRKTVPDNSPAGVKERLDRTLVEANLQIKQLEASTPARDGGPWASTVPVGLLTIGVISLIGASVWKWRSR